MKNKNKKSKSNMKFRDLRSIVFDYLACGFLFSLTATAVVLIAVFDSENRNSLNLIGLYVSVFIIGIIALFFFYLHIKYVIIYFPLKKDIALNRVKEAQINIGKAKPIRRIESKFTSYLVGLKICSTQGNIKNFYMFFNDESIIFLKSKNYKALMGLSLNISYYEKSYCIIACDEKEKIMKIIKK